MNITTIEPTKGHVLVKLPEKTTEVGGVIIAGDQANNAPVRGEIIRTPKSGSPFLVGETIFFRKYAVDELKFNQEDMSEVEVYIVDEREILGVVRPFEVLGGELEVTPVLAENPEPNQPIT